MKNKEITITKGSIVKSNIYRGYYKVTAIRGSKANLGTIFGSRIFHKGVSIDTLIECESEWYAKWQQSETYQCM